MGSHNRCFSLVGPLVLAVDSYHNSYCLVVMNLMDSLPVFVPKSNPRVTKKGFTPHKLNAMALARI